MPKKLKDGDTLDIWGRDYKLSHHMTMDELSEYSGFENCLGLHEPSKKTIHLATDQPDEEKKSTLLHEIFEAFKYIFGWGHIRESQMHKLERASYYTFKEMGIELPDIE